MHQIDCSNYAASKLHLPSNTHARPCHTRCCYVRLSMSSESSTRLTSISWRQSKIKPTSAWTQNHSNFNNRIVTVLTNSNVSAYGPRWTCYCLQSQSNLWTQHLVRVKHRRCAQIHGQPHMAIMLEIETSIKSPWNNGHSISKTGSSNVRKQCA